MCSSFALLWSQKILNQTIAKQRTSVLVPNSIASLAFDCHQAGLPSPLGTAFEALPSQMAQGVKNPPAIQETQETWVWSLGRETKIPTSCTGWPKKNKKNVMSSLFFNWFTSLRRWWRVLDDWSLKLHDFKRGWVMTAPKNSHSKQKGHK